MARILPFQSSGMLIRETDEFIDKISDAVMVLERAFQHYLDSGVSDELEERQTLENFVFLPALLRWYAGRSTQGDRTWRGPMMVERFFEILRRMLEQSRGDESVISVTFE